MLPSSIARRYIFRSAAAVAPLRCIVFLCHSFAGFCTCVGLRSLVHACSFRFVFVCSSICLLRCPSAGNTQLTSCTRGYQPGRCTCLSGPQCRSARSFSGPCSSPSHCGGILRAVLAIYLLWQDHMRKTRDRKHALHGRFEIIRLGRAAPTARCVKRYVVTEAGCRVSMPKE